jgi:hypothetical protein
MKSQARHCTWARCKGPFVLSSAALSLGSFVALWLMTPPLHAGAITSIDASVEETGPPFSWVNCDQSSAGAGVQCNLNSPATDNPSSSASSSASASFGNLSVAAGAGSLGDGLWQAGAQASASFSSDVIFSETGTITGTWFISYAGGGDEGNPAPDIQIMGTNVSIPFDPGASEAEGGFFVPITFTYSGGPIDISAALFENAASPGGESGGGSIQLVGFSTDYTMVPVVPETGTAGLTGMALLALVFFGRKMGAFNRRT